MRPPAVKITDPETGAAASVGGSTPEEQQALLQEEAEEEAREEARRARVAELIPLAIAAHQELGAWLATPPPPISDTAPTNLGEIVAVLIQLKAAVTFLYEQERELTVIIRGSLELFGHVIAELVDLLDAA